MIQLLLFTTGALGIIIFFMYLNIVKLHEKIEILMLIAAKEAVIKQRMERDVLERQRTELYG